MSEDKPMKDNLTLVSELRLRDLLRKESAYDELQAKYSKAVKALKVIKEHNQTQVSADAYIDEVLEELGEKE